MIWQLFELATISWFKKRIVSQEWGSTVFITFTVFYQQTLEIYQTLVHQKKYILKIGENMLNALFWCFLKNSQNVL